MLPLKACGVDYAKIASGLHISFCLHFRATNIDTTKVAEVFLNAVKQPCHPPQLLPNTTSSKEHVAGLCLIERNTTHMKMSAKIHHWVSTKFCFSAWYITNFVIKLLASLQFRHIIISLVPHTIL